jgi:hypothetical protein
MAEAWGGSINIGDLVIANEWGVGVDMIAVVTKRTETPKGPHYDLYFPKLQRTSYSWSHNDNLRRVT